ncbi:hypothetical protein [Ekhidna sp.]|jgi:predicted oxidoreductase|uniref:hypothetical protein n=1 Tax=Ekhidna sp. TaxID=2608089 RepID=UPI0032EFD045
MADITKYPKFFKAPGRGLYFKVISPFDCISLRILKTDTGNHLAINQLETGQAQSAAFIEDAGFDYCTAEEFKTKLLQASDLAHSFFNDLLKVRA